MKNYSLIVIFFLNISLVNSQIINKEYYENGQLSRTYETDSVGLNHGIELRYFNNGIVSEKKKWNRGQLIDSLFTYNQKGEIIGRGYINAYGLLKVLREDDLSYEGIVNDGKLNGQTLYFKDDKAILLKQFTSDVENGFGIILDDKSLKPKFIYESDDNQRNGILVNFYENAVIKSFRTSSLKSQASQYFEFYPTGGLKIIANMVFGSYHGYVYYFNVDGKIDKRVFYKNGIQVQD